MYNEIIEDKKGMLVVRLVKELLIAMYMPHATEEKPSI